MKTVFTTSGLHARDRFAYWHDVAGRVLTGHHSKAVSPDRFDAELRAADLADVSLYDFNTDAVYCERTTKHIANSQTDRLFLCCNLAGEFAIDQIGHRSQLAAGDMVLIDPNLRYSVRHTDGSRLIMAKIPRRVLEGRFGSMRHLFGAKLSGTQGINGFLATMLGTLGDHVDKFDQGTIESVRNQLVDLVLHAFGVLAGDDKRLSAPHSLAVMQLHAVIEGRLTDPALDSERVAKAAGLGLRHANALLEIEGTSIARIIRETRLERCREALANPAHDQRTISEIAFGWGFSDLTHFGRLFGAAFGVSPRTYRQTRPAAVDASPQIVEPSVTH